MKGLVEYHFIIKPDEKESLCCGLRTVPSRSQNLQGSEADLLKFIRKPTCVDPSAFKGALSGLRQFLATESPLKMMENAF